MGIELSSPKSIPAVVLDGLHSKSFSLTIDENNAKYVIRALGIPYGVDANGDRILTNDSNDFSQVNSDDFESEAVVWAIQNGQVTTPAEFLENVDAARLAINANPPSAAEALVNFENSLRMIYKISGTANASGLK